jgi:hypothetical protein
MGLFDNTVTPVTMQNPLTMQNIEYAIDKTYVPNNPAYDYNLTDTGVFLDDIASAASKAIAGVKDTVSGAYGAVTGTATNWLLILVIGLVLVVFFASKSTKLKIGL